MVEPPEPGSNPVFQGRDCGPADKVAPPEALCAVRQIMAEPDEESSNPKGSQARLRAGRSGRPFGGASEASCREISKMVGARGIEPRTSTMSR